MKKVLRLTLGLVLWSLWLLSVLLVLSCSSTKDPMTSHRNGGPQIKRETFKPKKATHNKLVINPVNKNRAKRWGIVK